MEKIIALVGRLPNVISLQGQIYAASGSRQKAYGIIRELTALRKERYVPPYLIARVYASLGDNKKVFEWLDKANEEKDIHLEILKIDPYFGEELRKEEHFKRLLKAAGFEQD